MNAKSPSSPGPQIHPEPGDPSRTRGLRLACMAIGVYGIACGVFGLPVGLFVGPHILLGAIAHLVIGFAFVASAMGLKTNRQWAPGAVLVVSGTCAVVSGIGLACSMIGRDYASAIILGVFFVALAVLFVQVAPLALRTTGRTTHRSEKYPP